MTQVKVQERNQGQERSPWSPDYLPLDQWGEEMVNDIKTHWTKDWFLFLVFFLIFPDRCCLSLVFLLVIHDCHLRLPVRPVQWCHVPIRPTFTAEFISLFVHLYSSSVSIKDSFHLFLKLSFVAFLAVDKHIRYQ